jgi:hypothetical protein
LDLAAGDYVTFVVQVQASTAVNWGHASTFTNQSKLQMTKLGGSTAAFVGVLAYNNTTQSIANATLTALTFNAEDFDTAAFHDNATNPTRLTAPKTGYYRLTAHAYAPFAASTAKHIRVRKNGTTELVTKPHPLPAAESGMEVTCVMKLTAADYVEVMVYQDQGGAQDMGHASTRATQNDVAMEYLGG